MQHISIVGAGLVSSLPEEWGLPGAFPQLAELWLGQNPGLTGAGPVGGSQGSVGFWLGGFGVLGWVGQNPVLMGVGKPAACLALGGRVAPRHQRVFGVQGLGSDVFQCLLSWQESGLCGWLGVCCDGGLQLGLLLLSTGLDGAGW